jgi:hypothetical protein
VPLQSGYQRLPAVNVWPASSSNTLPSIEKQRRLFGKKDDIATKHGKGTTSISSPITSVSEGITTYEVDDCNAGETVLVLPNIKTTTVRMDPGGGAIGLIDSQRRSTGFINNKDTSA